MPVCKISSTSLINNFIFLRVWVRKSNCTLLPSPAWKAPPWKGTRWPKLRTKSANLSEKKTCPTDPTPPGLKMIQAIDHCIAAQGTACEKCQIVKWVQRTENVEVEIDLRRVPSSDSCNRNITKTIYKTPTVFPYKQRYQKTLKQLCLGTIEAVTTLGYRPADWTERTKIKLKSSLVLQKIIKKQGQQVNKNTKTLSLGFGHFVKTNVSNQQIVLVFFRPRFNQGTQAENIFFKTFRRRFSID